MGLLWIGVREGRKAVRVPGVATLVLLDRRPLQFPPFSEGTGLGKQACSLFEASPCEPVATDDIPFSLVVFFPSSSWPLALRRKGGIVVGWCSGRTKRSASSRGGHPSPSRSSSPSIPPFFSRRLGRLEPVATFDLCFLHLVVYPFLPLGVPSFTEKRGNCRGLVLGKD